MQAPPPLPNIFTHAQAPPHLTAHLPLPSAITIRKHTHLWRLDADVFVELRVRQRQLHRLLDLLDLLLQAADVGVGLAGRVLHLHNVDRRVDVVAQDAHHVVALRRGAVQIAQVKRMDGVVPCHRAVTAWRQATPTHPNPRSPHPALPPHHTLLCSSTVDPGSSCVLSTNDMMLT